jgi:glycosyltransferase involved in cell wall biosynthesis
MTDGEWERRNVALVLASSTGGIGRHVASLAAGLADAGHTVTVYGPEATGRQFGFAESGVRFVPTEIPASPQPGDLRAVRALRRALAEDVVPDVVHAHGLRAGLVSGWAKPTGVPLVVTWHNAVLAGGLRARAYHLMERRVARIADVTLGASEDLVDRARALGAVDARLGAVGAPELHPALRTPGDVRAELGLEPEVPLVLSVGRLHPQKGYETLIAAAAKWRDRIPAPVVAIAGSGPAFLSLTAQISDSGAPVLLLGHRDDVPDLLAAATIGVVSSVWEARQLFAQEALRAGLPMVSTAVGGLPELLGDAAVLVQAGDVTELHDAVLELIEDTDRQAELTAAGFVQAARWPRDVDTITQVVDVYRELITARGTGAMRGSD